MGTAARRRRRPPAVTPDWPMETQKAAGRSRSLCEERAGLALIFGLACRQSSPAFTAGWERAAPGFAGPAQAILREQKRTPLNLPLLLFSLLPVPRQVRRLSVKRITSPIARDNLGHPVPGGLYDPAMGPLAPGERCGTCGRGGAACSGHFGHVDLAVPVYNPLVFGTMYKLLRCTCLHCYRFKMKAAEVRGEVRQAKKRRRGGGWGVLLPLALLLHPLTSSSPNAPFQNIRWTASPNACASCAPATPWTP